MFKKIKQQLKRFKKWIIAFIIGSAVFASGLAILPEQVKIPEHLKLKGNVLYSQDIDWIVCKKNNPSDCENKGKIKSYDYLTNKKINGKFFWKENNPYTNAQIISQKGNQIIARFYPSDNFYKNEIGEIFEIEHGATTTIDAFRKQTKVSLINKILKQAIADTTSYYIESAGTGFVLCSNANWATLRTLTTGSNVYTPDQNISSEYVQYNQTNTGYQIGNLFWRMDTSGLPDNATISSASLNLTTNDAIGSATKQEATAGSADIYIYEGTQGDTLTVADFRNYTGSKLATFDYDDWSAVNATLQTETLSDTSMISKTGYTYLCGRPAGDVDNVTPTGNNILVSSGFNTAGTTEDPYLSITYTIGEARRIIPVH